RCADSISVCMDALEWQRANRWKAAWQGGPPAVASEGAFIGSEHGAGGEGDAGRQQEFATVSLVDV
ncbi:MAG TPA: hypothetical protein VG900_03120, partial [Hyphomicrobiaceae bacterium]|nr:hypothetical protein [Hyphomicrobiaceae bacterium]